MVNSGWLDISNFEVFVEFSADEHGLNCGLDFRAVVCETFFHHFQLVLLLSRKRETVFLKLKYPEHLLNLALKQFVDSKVADQQQHIPLTGTTTVHTLSES